jgi:hypothetical protein
MLNSLYREITGIPITEIIASPHFSELQMFGGNLTEHEYQKKIDDLNEAFNATINSIINN